MTAIAPPIPGPVAAALSGGRGRAARAGCASETRTGRRELRGPRARRRIERLVDAVVDRDRLAQPDDLGEPVELRAWRDHQAQRGAPLAQAILEPEHEVDPGAVDVAGL